MRFLLCSALLILAACADSADPAVEADVPPAGASFTIAMDSLVIAVDSLQYTVALGYPQLRGSTGEPMSPTIRAVNDAIRDSVQSVADDFRPEEVPPSDDGFPYVVNLTGGPTRSFVSDDVLSVLVAVSAYTGGAHGNTFLLPLTFDLRTGEGLATDDLFRPGTAWADTLTAWTERGVLDRLALRRRATVDQVRPDFFAQGLDRLRQGEVTVTMGRDSLRVHIPPYQLSSYADGTFDIGVPYDAVGAMARPGSVLARRADR